MTDYQSIVNSLRESHDTLQRETQTLLERCPIAERAQWFALDTDFVEHVALHCAAVGAYLDAESMLMAVAERIGEARLLQQQIESKDRELAALRMQVSELRQAER